jgi:hypothetical protein
MKMSEAWSTPPAVPAVEVLSPTQGITMMKVENESMLSFAALHPRNESKVVEGALRELELAKEEAKAAYYSIPYRERKPGGGFRIVNVEGPSIHAAMALARRWGNCTCAARIVNEDENGFDLDGIFIDLETNFRLARPFRVSRIVKTRGGGVEILNPQRLLMAVQAGASKALRNAITGGLPAYLIRTYFERAKEIVGGKQDAPASAEKVAAVVKGFERFKVDGEKLEAYLDRKRDEWTGADVATLRGLWNAIVQEQITVAEAFEEPADSGAAITVAAGALTPESIAGGTSSGVSTGPGPRPVRAPSSP